MGSFLYTADSSVEQNSGRILRVDTHAQQLQTSHLYGQRVVLRCFFGIVQGGVTCSLPCDCGWQYQGGRELHTVFVGFRWRIQRFALFRGLHFLLCALLLVIGTHATYL